jgi:hypothetical protein
MKFSVYVFKTLIYTFKDGGKFKGGKKKSKTKSVMEDEEDETLQFELVPPLPLQGDIKIDFSASVCKGKPMFNNIIRIVFCAFGLIPFSLEATTFLS